MPVASREVSKTPMDPNIGIITALPKEYVAVKALLENRREYVVPGRGAGRRYLLGDVPTTDAGKHSVVLTLADVGNDIAAARATLLLEHFPTIESIIMVGIAGGIPYPEKPDEHVRLGDVVISDHRGIIQYDFVKEEIRESIHRHPPRPTSASLLDAVRLLQAAQLEGSRPWLPFIGSAGQRLSITRPPQQTDVLTSSSNPDIVIDHPADPTREPGQPKIHTGPIASANRLLMNPTKRDELRARFDVRAVEMEGSGIADATWNHEVWYLVVRGICDYCDSTKNDQWQDYAAVVAAAYTRALLESVPARTIGSEARSAAEAPHRVSLNDVLSVSIENVGHSPHEEGSGQWWIRLIVESRKVVEQCRGQIHGLYTLASESDQHGKPHPRFQTSVLSWADGLFEAVTITPEEPRYLDLVWRAAHDPPIPEDELRIASARDRGVRDTESPDWGKRQDFIPLKPGFHALEIRVVAEGYSRLERRYRVHWPGPGRESEIRLLEFRSR